MEQLISEIVIPLLGIVLTVIAGMVARKFGKALDIEIEDDAVKTAVLYAEELARKYVKEHSAPPPGWRKLNIAVEHVQAAIPKYQRIEFRKLLEKKIEAKVNEIFHGPDAAPAMPGESAPRSPEGGIAP